MNKEYVHTGYNKSLKNNARYLRTNMTKEERHLWYDFLRQYTPRFYRQRPIDNYILDFYCPKVKLAIELDGSQHYDDENKEYDMNRTNVLRNYDITVLRFDNTDINKNFKSVCEAIDNYIKDILCGLG